MISEQSEPQRKHCDVSLTIRYTLILPPRSPYSKMHNTSERSQFQILYDRQHMRDRNSRCDTTAATLPHFLGLSRQLKSLNGCFGLQMLGRAPAIFSARVGPISLLRRLTASMNSTLETLRGENKKRFLTCKLTS